MVSQCCCRDRSFDTPIEIPFKRQRDCFCYITMADRAHAVRRMPGADVLGQRLEMSVAIAIKVANECQSLPRLGFTSHIKWTEIRLATNVTSWVFLRDVDRFRS